MTSVIVERLQKLIGFFADLKCFCYSLRSFHRIYCIVQEEDNLSLLFWNIKSSVIGINHQKHFSRIFLQSIHTEAKLSRPLNSENYSTTMASVCTCTVCVCLSFIWDFCSVPHYHCLNGNSFSTCWELQDQEKI